MAESLLWKCVSCCKKMGRTRLETETVSARRRRGELLCKYQERQRLQLGCVRASKQVSATCLPHLMSSLCRTSDSLMGAAPSRLMYIAPLLVLGIFQLYFYVTWTQRRFKDKETNLLKSDCVAPYLAKIQWRRGKRMPPCWLPVSVSQQTVGDNSHAGRRGL